MENDLIDRLTQKGMKPGCSAELKQEISKNLSNIEAALEKGFSRKQVSEELGIDLKLFNSALRLARAGVKEKNGKRKRKEGSGKKGRQKGSVAVGSYNAILLEFAAGERRYYETTMARWPKDMSRRNAPRSRRPPALDGRKFTCTLLTAVSNSSVETRMLLSLDRVDGGVKCITLDAWSGSGEMDLLSLDVGARRYYDTSFESWPDDIRMLQANRLHDRDFTCSLFTAVGNSSQDIRLLICIERTR